MGHFNEFLGLILPPYGGQVTKWEYFEGYEDFVDMF